MEHPLFWPALLYAMLCVLMAGYTLLDGFDLGVGMLLPWFPAPEDRKTLLASLAPVWDGNEVWLIICGGALFAVFPDVYAAALSNFYIPVMLVIFSLVLRAAAFEFWHQDLKRRALWGVIFSVSSFFIPFLLGLVMGNVIQGIPLAADMHYSGSRLLLFRPLPLVLGLCGTAFFCFHGLAYVMRKTDKELLARCRYVAKHFWWICAAGLACLLSELLSACPWSGSRPGLWAGIGITSLGLALAWKTLRQEHTANLWVWSSLGIIGLWVSLVSIQYPMLIRSSLAPAFCLTLANASSPILVLKIIGGFILLGMLLVIGYTWFVYRVFRGKPHSDQSY